MCRSKSDTISFLSALRFFRLYSAAFTVLLKYSACRENLRVGKLSVFFVQSSKNGKIFSSKMLENQADVENIPFQRTGMKSVSATLHDNRRILNIFICLDVQDLDNSSQDSKFRRTRVELNLAKPNASVI